MSVSLSRIVDRATRSRSYGRRSSVASHKGPFVGSHSLEAKNRKRGVGAKMNGSNENQSFMTDRKVYDKWKTLVPYLYDFFTSSGLTWPSLTCRWGPIIKREKYKNRQRIYFSEQTDSSDVQKLCIGYADIYKVSAGPCWLCVCFSILSCPRLSNSCNAATSLFGGEFVPVLRASQISVREHKANHQNHLPSGRGE